MALGMVEVDEATAFLAFPNFLRFNEPQSANAAKAWVPALDLTPECAGKRRLVARCRQYLEGRSDDFRKAVGDAVLHAFAEAFPDAMPYPGAGAGAGAGAGSSPPTPHRGESFDRFWALYPRKTDKLKARKAWDRLKPENGLAEEILAAVGRQRTWPAWSKDGGAFIPHASTWLRGERWKDEPPTNGAGRGRVNEAWAGKPTGEIKL
jgi:hypothetical protein